MKLQIFIAVLLFLTLINSQDVTDYTNYEDYDDEQSMPNFNLQSYKGPLAVGAFSLIAYLGLGAAWDILLRSSWTPLENYPDCGRREENIETEDRLLANLSLFKSFINSQEIGRFCLQDCTMIQLDTVYNLQGQYRVISPDWINSGTKKPLEFESVDIDVRLDRVPQDITCLDDCYFFVYEAPLNKNRNLCYLFANSEFDCVLLDSGTPKESNETSAFNGATTNYTDQKSNKHFSELGLSFTVQTVEDQALMFCLEEQGITSVGEIEDLIGSYKKRSKSLFCAYYLRISWEVPASKNQKYPFRLPSSRVVSQTRVKKLRKQLSKQIATLVGKDYGQTYRDSRAPWHCSLRTTGFRGTHRCGVTLLSAWPEATILVSAAHCNQICKDSVTNQPLEICCCRVDADPGSCKNSSSYCGFRPELMEADPIDLQIVCGEFSLELAPETYSKENERVLQIEKITNHPKYLLGYPALGFDIAVYHVKNPQELRALNSDNVDPIANKTIYPACLPKLSFSQYNNAYPGDFYAWKDPEPTFKAPVEILRTYVRDNLLPREDKLNKVECGDPGWMNSNTYYPPGTICFKSIVQDSCVEFGNSGSPVTLRAPWELSGKQKISRFHWAGTLSLSKGCDQTFVSLVNSNSRKTSVPKLQIRSENPAVFTDARCYLDWIAEQYNHKPPVGYTRPKQCEIAVGDRLDKDNEMCRTNRNTTCDLTNTKCNLEAFEGYAYNIYRCNDTNGNMVNCANNCKGVDPNAVVVGGIAVGVTSAVGAAIANGIGTGVVGVGLPFLGGMAMMGMMRNERCLRSQCRPLNSPRCCNRLQNGSCPRRC